MMIVTRPVVGLHQPMSYSGAAVGLDTRKKPLETTVQAADVMKPRRSQEVPGVPSSAEVIEQTTLRGWQQEGEVVEGERYQDRDAGGELAVRGQAIEPLLEEAA